jgi:predicted O-methyltransferase YrrM
MLSGWQQGLLLQMLSQMLRPRYVLEIGTFTGYSAICLSQGLLPDGALHTFDPDDEVLAIARQFIGRSDRAAQIVVHAADAKRAAPALGIEFDLIFMDGDKREYPDDYAMALPLLRAGGFLLVDNVLWDNKILTSPPPADKHTAALQRFNEMVRADERVEKVILPVRDGVMVVRKR